MVISSAKMIMHLVPFKTENKKQTDKQTNKGNADHAVLNGTFTKECKPVPQCTAMSGNIFFPLM